MCFSLLYDCIRVYKNLHRWKKFMVENKKWEYRVHTFDYSNGDITLKNRLDDLGEDGWELISAIPGRNVDNDTKYKRSIQYILKRESKNFYQASYLVNFYLYASRYRANGKLMNTSHTLRSHKQTIIKLLTKNSTLGINILNHFNSIAF